MSDVAIVIPCFNEAIRFKTSEADRLLDNAAVRLVFVNDGSTDQTLNVLSEFRDRHRDRVTVINFEMNRGKAEAVREGLQHALQDDAQIVGYLDADFATPAAEMLRLIGVLKSHAQIQAVLGARWLHLGADIERNMYRHYGGRVFATLASVVLDLKVYDTQCGAKLFRAGEPLKAALAQEFKSRWAFDVELIGRLRRDNAQQQFMEVPLKRWIDVAGSKITLLDMFRATLSLLLIRRALKRFYSNSLGGHQGKNSGIS